MRYLILALSILLSGCGGEASAKQDNQHFVQERAVSPKMEATWTGQYSTWWELPQYYSGTPKYSGSFGTYTHKHIPVAVNHGDDLFSVRTDNTEDENFYVYVMKNNRSVKVHTIKNWDDPHTNAAINVDNSGYVWVHIASRGLAHKFQSGKVLKSITPYELDFECVSGCSDEDINYEAYPQIHNASWGIHKIYTHYELVGDRNYRKPWSMVNGVRQKFTDNAAYQISHYSEGELCVASNRLINGDPDNRQDVYLLCTGDGTSWYDQRGESVNLPLNTYNWHAKIFDSMDNSAIDDKQFLTYLKDIYKFNGKWRVLFTRSESADPTKGERWLVEWVEGDYQLHPREITKVGHNYSAGAYIEKDGQLYIVVGKSNSTGYLSGSLELYDTDYTLFDTLQGDYSYARRVRGADGKAVMSQGASDIKVRGKHFTLEIK